MKITKNEVTADEIDALFCEKFCDYCTESGNCEGCIIQVATQAARNTTTLAVDVAKSSAQCGCLAYEGTGKLCGYCNRPPRH